MTAPVAVLDPRYVEALLDPARLEAVAESRFVDDPPAAALARVCRLAARLLGVPWAMVSVVADRQIVVAAEGFELCGKTREYALENSLSKYAVVSQAPVVVDDAANHPWASTVPSVAAGVIGAYLDVPLRTASGHVIGAVCALSDSPHAWSTDDVEVLGDLAAGLIVEIELRAAAARAADSEARLLDALAEARRSTQALAASQAELAHRNLHDPLTGLPSRDLFVHRLREAIAARTEADDEIAVLFLDLDRFKVVNDSLGHAAGDDLLRIAANRLGHAIRPGDTAARLGGDEFAVCLPGVTDAEAAQIADRLLETLRRPYVLRGRDIGVSVSIGIAFGDTTGVTPEALLRDADSALYEAKRAGRDRAARFNQGLRTQVIGRLDTEADLRRALAQNEFALHYQPAFDLSTGEVAGVEALLRWQHPERGLVPPAVFIPVAEETGQIVPIGAWVLEEACRQIVQWRANGLAPPRVWVNISARQLQEPDFGARAVSVIAEHGIHPGELGMEVTESVVIDDAMTGLALAELAAAGVPLAVDDFGTGYSSLAYLHRFRAELLKIDRSFVDQVDRNRDNEAIVTAVVGLAHMLGRKATAEGVEQVGELEQLRRVGCDMACGYLLARPLPAAQLEPMLAPGYAHPAIRG